MFFPAQEICELSPARKRSLDVYLQSKLGMAPTTHQSEDFLAFIEFLPKRKYQRKIIARLSAIAATVNATIESVEWWDIGLCTKERILMVLVKKDDRPILFSLCWKQSGSTDKRMNGVRSFNLDDPGWVPDASAPSGRRQEIIATTYKEMKALFEARLRQLFPTS